MFAKLVMTVTAVSAGAVLVASTASASATVKVPSDGDAARPAKVARTHHARARANAYHRPTVAHLR